MQVFQPSPLFYTSFKDDDHSVGNLLCLGEVMGDIQSGNAKLSLNALELKSQILRGLPIQTAQRFVQKEYSGIRGQSPGQGHFLLFSAAKVPGIGGGQVFYLK